MNRPVVPNPAFLLLALLLGCAPAIESDTSPSTAAFLSPGDDRADVSPAGGGIPDSPVAPAGAASGVASGPGGGPADDQYGVIPAAAGADGNEEGLDAGVVVAILRALDSDNDG